MSDESNRSRHGNRRGADGSGSHSMKTRIAGAAGRGGALWWVGGAVGLARRGRVDEAHTTLDALIAWLRPREEERQAALPDEADISSLIPHCPEALALLRRTVDGWLQML